MPKLSALFAFLLLAAVTTAAHAKTITGPARVIDGDTLEINGRQVRLLGIDAPEAAQVFKLPSGTKDFLGRGAALMLRALIRGNTVRCDVAAQGDDRGLPRATCYSGKDDLSAEMVSGGMARATTAGPSPYAEHEKRAERERRGFWRDTVEAPWDFRRRRISEAEPSAPNACVFKARVDDDGRRTLVTPWSPWYGQVRMDEAKGDRWFCSESEAIAAGWTEPYWLMRSVISGVYDPYHRN